MLQYTDTKCGAAVKDTQYDAAVEVTQYDAAVEVTQYDAAVEGYTVWCCSIRLRSVTLQDKDTQSDSAGHG